MVGFTSTKYRLSRGARPPAAPSGRRPAASRRSRPAIVRAYGARVLSSGSSVALMPSMMMRTRGARRRRGDWLHLAAVPGGSPGVAQAIEGEADGRLGAVQALRRAAHAALGPQHVEHQQEVQVESAGRGGHPDKKLVQLIVHIVNINWIDGGRPSSLAASAGAGPRPGPWTADARRGGPSAGRPHVVGRAVIAPCHEPCLPRSASARTRPGSRQRGGRP